MAGPHEAEPPRCPKHCDVATPPELIRPGRYVCSGCGTEFGWPDRDAAEPPPLGPAGSPDRRRGGGSVSCGRWRGRSQ